MKQLVQLQTELGDLLKEHEVQVLVVFREESDGQEGLRKVVEQTATDFTLTLDENAEATGPYSSGNKVHDSYVVGADGMLHAILPGKRYDRAQASEFAATLSSIEARRKQ